MWHRARVASDRQPEESLCPGLVVGVFRAGQQGLSDIRAICTGERPQTERGPVADLGVAVLRQPDQRHACLGLERLPAEGGSGEGDGQPYFRIGVQRKREDETERARVVEVPKLSL